MNADSEDETYDF